MKNIHFKYFLIPLLFLGVITSAFSQNINVTGKVAEKKSGETMPGSTVMLLNPADSSFYKFSTTNSEGSFSIKGAKAGKYILQISFIGYDSYYKSISLTSDKKNVDLGTLQMKTKQALLETVNIVEEIVPVIINGDTIEFNAAAFKTQPEDNVAALLKKLPGIEVESDGTIKAQGEEVQRVLIDGKEFFGDDTKTATENLPADMVKSVQVYDDFSDASKMTGIDDGDRTKTINLKIKKDRKKGVFGNVTAGGGVTAKGTGDFNDENGMFNNKLNINKFKNDMQLSVLGMFNNTNEQGFSYKDYLNFSGGSANAFGGGGGSSIPMNNNPDDGFTTTTAGGINWNKDLTPKINLSSSYFYSELTKKVYRESDRQYITDSTDFNSLEKDNENQFNRNHSFRIKYDHKIDTTQDLKIKVNFNYSEGNVFSYTTSQSNDANDNFLNSSNNNNQSTGTNLSGDGKLTYGKRFQKKGRSLVANVSYGTSDNEKRYFVESQNSFADGFGGVTTSNIKQIQDENNNQFNYSGKVSYTEPVGKRKYLELSYQRSNYNYEYIKDFFDIPAPNTEVFNSNLSLAYNNNFDYDNYKLNFKFNTDKSKLTIGAAAQKSTLDGEIVTTNFDTTRINWNVLPRLKWNYSFTKSTRLNLNYTTNVQEPSLEQLQPTIDNSNPLNIYQGNPDLTSEYRHNLRLRLMSFNRFSFVNIFGMLSGTYTKNKITNSQSIDSRFVQTITPVNVDNDYALSAYIYFGSPIRPLGSKINIRLNSSYNKSILFVNTDANDVDRYNNGIDFSIENRGKDIVDVKVGTKISHNTTAYSISSSLDQEYLTTGYYADLFIDFLKTWTFSTHVEYTQYSGDQFADNPDIPIWRAHISKRFLKGKSGLLKLSVYDIFNQNVGINRTSQLNYIEDERVTTISRYVMLSFTYKVRRFGGKKKKTKESKNS
ncbi:MAG: outer membrane beta-barrel protein [Flavobacteriales bacterium]|nr:outer membrane beta-barrel protein [Flavobacteriales bacterium]